MKLYTRLIESGAFIFWNEDEKDATFNLRIRILVGDKKVELVNINPTAGQNYYSFDRVGSGEYEIELNAFENNSLYQTEIKNVEISSTVEKNVENFHALIGSLAVINENIKNVQFDTSRTNNNIDELYDLLSDIKRALTDPRTIVSVERKTSEFRRQLNEFEEY